MRLLPESRQILTANGWIRANYSGYIIDGILIIIHKYYLITPIAIPIKYFTDNSANPNVEKPRITCARI